MPIKVLIFDAYGTLYDVHSVQAQTEQLCPGKGDLIAQIWRLKQLEYNLRGADRPRGHGNPAAPDPRDLEAEMFCAGDIETVGRYEQHLVVLQAQPRFHQRIAFRMRLKFARIVDADGRIEKSVKPGILDQSGQHGRAAV